MEIMPKQASAKGPAQWFTGDVWIDAIARGQEPSRVSVSAVRFTPGARATTSPTRNTATAEPGRTR